MIYVLKYFFGCCVGEILGVGSYLGSYCCLVSYNCSLKDGSGVEGRWVEYRERE